MKYILHLVYFIFISISLSSCTYKFDNIDENKPIGLSDDNIKLSINAVEFNSAGDSVTIKTGGSSWWLTNIKVDSTYFYNFNGVNLQPDSFKIIQDCFDVERRDKNTLFIKVDANTNFVKRIITVVLQDGDIFDKVTITQKPKY